MGLFRFLLKFSSLRRRLHSRYSHIAHYKLPRKTAAKQYEVAKETVLPYIDNHNYHLFISTLSCNFSAHAVV